MHILFQNSEIPKKQTIVVLIHQDGKLSSQVKELDKQAGGAITKLTKKTIFSAEKTASYLIDSPASIDNEAILVVAVGKAADNNDLHFQNLGGKIYSALIGGKIEDAFILVEGKDSATQAANIAYGIKLKSYLFDKYKTKEKKEDKPSLKNIHFALKDHAKADEHYNNVYKKIANGVFFARDVVTEPPNILHPESYAELCDSKLSALGVEVKILGEKDMTQLGMGSLLGVGQGSIRESKLVIMKWNGASDPDATPIAFVGKGVTFDTGGISLKPSNGMEDMKYDMGGSAAVVGLMKALAGRKAKVNAIGVVGLVENMPGHNAQRPSDVVHSMSGQTIEVLNTDAEGRLVLADALWYTQDKYRPQFMVNLATLTGAIVVTLADLHAGLFSNNDKLSKHLTEAGEKTGEKLWRLPIDPVGEGYDKMIDSKIADIQNIGNGRGAGSITAGQFLQRFVNDTPWAHLDIAGMAWTKKPKDLTPEGAVGFGVRLLDQMIQDHYEDSAA